MIRRLRDWHELRKAERRYRFHLGAKELLPNHTYPLLESDKELIARSVRRKL
jgi:hypothetical protein